MTASVHVPDVLETIAQLPNDEVFTHPWLANAMLDLLPEHVWSEPKYKWLDPATKSGVFLREVANRLMGGLAAWERDPARRREHIYRNMLYGCATSHLTGEVARRSLYHSMDATGSGLKDEHLKDLIVRFDAPYGNVPFIQTEHTFVNGKCELCKAPEDLERGSSRENYAYPFIHGTYPTKELSEMKFDVIVGNPPYQIDSDGNSRTMPVYQRFVRKAIDMNPRYVVMITPSRWFTGGLGLDEYRRQMVSDRRIAKLVDNPKLFDCFPGVEVKGGVSYFLWDREHNDDCEFSVRIDGVVRSTMVRDLRHGRGVLVRSNEAEKILRKVERLDEASFSTRISAQKPFGLLSNFSDFTDKPYGDALRLYKRGLAPAWVRREQVTMGHGLIEPIKVLTPEAGDGHGRIPAIVTGNPFVVVGNSVCTQTFLVAGTWPDSDTAARVAAYLRTKFVRFLIHQRKVSQHTTSDAYVFVPDLPMDREWSDENLYQRYGLSADEIAYIESQIKPMDAVED